MNSVNIKIGHVYGNGKGMFRKVRRFTNTLGKECVTPYDIWYVRCSESGAVSEKAKEQVCWHATFAQWAIEEFGYLGNFEPSESA